MNKLSGNKITPNEAVYILIGIMLDLNIVSIANALVPIAKQTSWISALLGGVYPLYVGILAVFVSRKYPKDNILTLSKNIFGNIIGNILNFLFLISLMIYFCAGLSEVTIISRTYVVPFLSSLKIYVSILLLAAYTASKGLKTVSRICFFNFIGLITLIIISLGILRNGSLLNVSPVFGVSLKKIIAASRDSAYDYALMETVFLIYPLIEDSKKIKTIVLKSTAFIVIVYTWITFISIYYLGIDIIPKTIWAFVEVSRDIEIKNITNLRYLVLFILLFISIKSMSILYYLSLLILDNIKKIKNKPIVIFLIGILVIYVCKNYFKTLHDRNEILEYAIPVITIYNLSYVSVISLVSLLKKDDIVGKKQKK
ncbi:hypothetical protein Q428_02190 [Fervidicella metallireducens AeB]|uniref:Spore germination protein n=1 Tax=Fervidicella metallireducens AeB TaxID=1403537 RepID=A0A017RXW9_9CLOT|nr:GerAB/ArcD/ProY family transporter [Fervidicella metallireducens]EYE89431.1 hypothetical protein Q428_02190 [Fervidicella metallireducens AeB]